MPQALPFTYYICKKAVGPASQALPRWPRMPCRPNCGCREILVKEGKLGDEHRVNWDLPENQP